MADINTIWDGWHAEELLGQGSYGKVYRMSRTELGHTSYAAAKLIEIPQDASEVASLAAMGMDNLSIRSYFEDTARGIVNEIAVMESLKGARNVVAIEDYRLVEREDGVGWTICIRMELLQALTDYQKASGPPSVEETIRIGIDICNALICCEERNVIHRDVKPENIFRSAFGDYKLGDFGISRQIENSTKSAYSQKGTGPYMAPEVVRGQKYGSSVDVYSLGIMLYRYLNKMRFPFLPPAPDPFTADDMEQALLRRLRGDELPAPSEADADLAAVICRACAADPTSRYRSARELSAELVALQAGRPLPDRSGGGAGVQGQRTRCEEKHEDEQLVWRHESKGQSQSLSERGSGRVEVDAPFPADFEEGDGSVDIQDCFSRKVAAERGGAKRDGEGEAGKGGSSRKRAIIIALCVVIIVGAVVFASAQFSQCSASGESNGVDDGASSAASVSSAASALPSDSNAANGGDETGNAISPSDSSASVANGQAFPGAWYLERGEASSLGAGNVADMWDFGLGATLEIAKDGTGTLHFVGKSSPLSWVAAGERAVAEIDGRSCTMQSEGDSLVLSGYGGGDLYFGATSPERGDDGYILADSSSKAYGSDELEQLSRYELCLARNEIFIREGQASESAQIARRYRGMQAEGGEGAGQAVLSPIENANVMTISRVEWSQNTIYRNMLSTERRECYLAYREKLADALGANAAQLGGLADGGRIALALLVDFDGTADTFEDLLVAFRSGSGYDVELWSYAEGSVSVERSDAVSSTGSLVLAQRDDGCRLESGSGGISWGSASGDVLSETEFDFASQAASGSASSPRLAQDQLAVLAQETVKTLQADYCDDAPFYGVWLPAVDDVDDAWRDAVELQALGFDAWKVQPRWWSGLDGGEDDFMVTAGRFASEVEAEGAAAELRDLGYGNLTVSYSGEFEG